MAGDDFPAYSNTAVENWRCFNKLAPTNLSQKTETSKKCGRKSDSALITWFSNTQYLKRQHKNGTKGGKLMMTPECWICWEVTSAACLEVTNNFENILWCIRKYLHHCSVQNRTLNRSPRCTHQPECCFYSNAPLWQMSQTSPTFTVQRGRNTSEVSCEDIFYIH